MALWQQFNSIGVPPGIHDNFHGVYSLPKDELIICLRVVFANWIEASIGIISPAAFVRALEFQIASTLRKKRTLPIEPTNLRHPSRLSSYHRLLQKYETQEAIDELYWKFVHCFHEEYNVIRLYEMDNFNTTELYDLIESLQKDSGTVENASGQVGRADLCMQMQTISNESSRFPVLLQEIRDLVNELGASFKRFDGIHQVFLTHQFVQDPSEAVENEPHFNLLIVVSKDLLFKAQQILRVKANIEHKLREIRVFASTFNGHLQNYLHYNEKLHAFGNRSVKRSVEDLTTQAEKAFSFLNEMCSLSSGVVDADRFNYLKILDITHDVMMTLSSIRAETEHPELGNMALYNTAEINEIVQQLENLQWSIVQICTLVMECHPPSVMVKGSPRPIAVRFFKFGNTSASKLTVKVYLVNENTVKEIRTGLRIPDRISRITPQSKKCDAVAGNIVIANDSQPTNRARAPPSFRGQRVRAQRRPVIQKRRTSEDSIDSLPSFPVVHLVQENVENMKSCYFDKVLLVKTIYRSSKTDQPCVGKRRIKSTQNQPKGNKSRSIDNVANDKVALLFVTEIPFKNEIRKVWTISLPMIVAAHGSQCEKAYATMAWDEVMYTPTRQGFEVGDTASWSQVSEMLKGTFENLVGEPLKPHHLLYVKRKVQQFIGISLQSHTPISKNLICEVQNSTCFWAWFYRSISIIKTNSPCNDAWKSGYIEGFIDYDHAAMVLRNNSPQVKPGTMIVRFSDTAPGSLTIVFMGFDKKIYKMQPMNLYKKTALPDCATILLSQLNAKENVHKKEIFSHVYPNIAKEHAFENIYQWAARQTTPTFQGYVVMSLFVPLSGPTSPADGGGDDGSASPTSSNDSNADDENNDRDFSSIPVIGQESGQFLCYNSATTRSQSPFQVPPQLESMENFYVNIQPSEIRNYSIIV